ncbi:hypothetical protein A3D23_07070 [candidate division WOR-1 bacterium RIFCSPHIGHO2_02_FULL_53_26]|nr:MAG: hypothetical protein A3D23_07070 [candidate division WOR-1 bacterium RIFCSPHIGHO2_02_FULL_53_26]
MPKKKKKAKKVIAKKSTKKAIKMKPAKAVKKTKVKAKSKIQAVKAPKEKVLGRVEHFFDKISVAAISVKAPFKVGDIIHIKGHTTDFVQRVDSIQIEHESVAKVKKGDDIGIKVKDYARQHDMVYLSNEKELGARPATTAMQQPMFPTVPAPKAAVAAPVKPVAPTRPPAPQPKADPYGGKKFFSF